MLPGSVMEAVIIPGMNGVVTMTLLAVNMNVIRKVEQTGTIAVTTLAVIVKGLVMIGGIMNV